jgi:hypothetical protein
MKSIFAQYGVLSSGLALTTATPTINSLNCSTTINDDSYVGFSVTNNDALTASIEVSLFPDFINSSTLSVNSTASGSFSLIANDNPPDTVTVYARATASGKVVSLTETRTENLVLCIFEN